VPSEASLDCGVRDTKAAALRQACSCAIAQALSRASSSASTPACSAEIGGTSGLMPAETESSLPSLQFHGLEEAPAARVLEHHADEEFNSWTVTVPQSYLARDCARAAVACRHRGTMAPQDETYVSVPIKQLPRNLCVTQVSSHLPMLLGGYLRFSGAVEVLCAP